MEWAPIIKRIIKARFYSKYKKLTVIQTYSLTNDTTDEVKMNFTLTSCIKYDIIVLMGDLNAKLGEDNTNRNQIMGRYGVGDMNDNGERLFDVLSIYGLVITGTLFPHKEIHKVTWRSPDERTTKQIDLVFVTGCMRSSIMDKRVMRGPDIYSDHYLVGTRISLKLGGIERGCKEEKGSSYVISRVKRSGRVIMLR